MQPSFVMQPPGYVDKGGLVGYPHGQMGYTGEPKQTWDDLLGKCGGTMISWWEECGGCDPKPPCVGCFQSLQLPPLCDLCQDVAEPCCGAEGGSERIQPRARIYSTRVGRSVYYDAAMRFLPETAVLTLHPQSKSTEESKKSQAYLIIQIQLPAKFK